MLRISKFFRMILSKSLCVYAGAVFDDGDLEAVSDRELHVNRFFVLNFGACV